MMLSAEEQRASRIAKIKESLGKVPIISKNQTHITARIDQMNKFELSSLESSASIPENQLKYSNIERGIFEEKYELGKKIGQGANGLVRECFHRETKRIYAVKTMMMDEEHIMTLKQNFLNVRRLNHPSIIKFRALYIDMKKHLSYLVMEYVTEPNLLDYMKENNFQVYENELNWIFFELFSAIQYLHLHKISHRDIKPENILINTQQKRIKLIDFGSSRCTQRRKQNVDMLTITGTLVYRAPQMFIGGGYSEKVDIWAAGITLYKILTGKMPFQFEFHSDTINSILNEEPDIQIPELEEKKLIKDLLHRLLCKDPKERPQAKDVLNHLWFKKKIGEKQLISSDFFSEQTQYSKYVPKQTDYDPSSLKIEESIKNVNGADYHQLECD